MGNRTLRNLSTLALLLGVWAGSSLAAQSAGEDKRKEILAQEEELDYYQKWLKEDVVYIISPEERQVFSSLTTPEEKERFIEQFWRRRDPDLTTIENEAKEEHYRRIAYANENFAAGMDGWRTDRGRIYIIHGAPDERQSHTAGSNLNREFSEGGGRTRTFPYEVWRYRYIEGLGEDVVLEFVDKTFSGSFELAMTPWDKDMLVNVPGQGMTLAEEIGAATRADHPYFNRGVQDQELYPMLNPRAADRPFERMERVFKSQRPTSLKYNDLKEIVDINFHYEDLDYSVRQDYLSLNEEQSLVPITLQWDNKNLTFERDPLNGMYVARIGVYGLVTGLSNEIVAEFEDDVVSRYSEGQKEFVSLGQSMYQKVLGLKAGGRYKLTLVAKDLVSSRVGVKNVGLIVPGFKEEELSLSTVILSNFVRRLEGTDLDKEDLMFVLGDLWIRPSVDRVFRQGQDLGIYLQAYHVALDNQTLQPDLEVSYQVQGAANVNLNLPDPEGKSVDFFSGRRVVLLKILRLSDLPPGRYSLVVEVRDKITGKTAQVRERFQVTES